MNHGLCFGLGLRLHWTLVENRSGQRLRRINPHGIMQCLADDMIAS